MISFWVDAPGRFTIDAYLATRGEAIAHRFSVRTYEELQASTRIAPGGQIMGALDQLTAPGRELAAEMWDRVREAAPGWALLNDPRRVLLRLPLLTAMADTGLNDFRAWPAHGDLSQVRYPVFVREANRHTGSHTGLLESPRALRGALRALRFRGLRLSDLLVVEYLHTADEQGRFRKYAAYRVGSVLVRTHLMVGHCWLMKSDGDESDLDAVREMSAYLESDLHEDWLWRVFELAGIDFGRLDYGVLDGRPQLWEINMNPTMCRRPGKPPRPGSDEVRALRDEARTAAHARLRTAFLALDRAVPPEPVTVPLPPALVAAARARRVTEQRRQAALAALGRLFHSEALGRPVRALYGRLLPRR
jgi:hypothetical protein